MVGDVMLRHTEPPTGFISRGDAPLAASHHGQRIAPGPEASLLRLMLSRLRPFNHTKSMREWPAGAAAGL